MQHSDLSPAARARLRELASKATARPWEAVMPNPQETYVYAPDARYEVPWAGESPVKVAWIP